MNDILLDPQRVYHHVITSMEFNKIKSGIRDKLGKYLYQETECKPMILIVVQEV